jgi:hypothetical protein
VPIRSDDPLRRITLNLYEADCVVMEETYGYGWTTRVRDLVHQAAKTVPTIIHTRTLGDLTDD